MILLATADENWAISKNKQPLVRIPADQRFFRSETQGKTVIMGYRGLLDLPGSQPVGGRETIVLAPEHIEVPRLAVHAASVEEVLSLVEGKKSDEVYVAGGASVYRAFLPYCDTAYITLIEFSYEADTYLNNFDQDEDWIKTGISEEQTYYDLTYHFIRYERKNKKTLEKSK